MAGKIKSNKARNEQISTANVVLIDRGKRELPLGEAIELARKEGGDLEEVRPGEDPARCKIVMLALEETPTALVRTIQALDQEEQPFRRVHRLIDAIEVFTKLHTVALVSDIFSSDNITEKMRGILAAGLKRPSLGVWWSFARRFASRYPKLERTPILPGIDQFVGSKGELFKLLEKGDDNLIAFRNHYAHGATPSDEQCVADCELHEPRLRAAIAHAGHLRNAQWVVIDAEGRCLEAVGSEMTEIPPPVTGLESLHCYLINGEEVVSLHPLMIFDQQQQRFFFYNDLRANDANYLNYEKARHKRDRELRAQLLQRYPIDDWSRHAPEDFTERIEQLTETFKGRRDELQDLYRFCETGSKGFHMVWGGPGIGKSTLLARLVQILRWPTEIRRAEGLFVRQTDSQVDQESDEKSPENFLVFEYFIHRGQRTAAADYMLSNLNDRLETAFRTGVPKGNTPAEKSRFLEERLARAVEHIQPSDRILLFIDGLDEGSDAPGLLDAIPKDLPDKVLALYGSRDIPIIRQRVYENLDREHRGDQQLGGLQKGDVLALLSDSVSKYEIENSYLEAVASVSEGNPLYLRLLCQGLSEGDFQINESARLPNGMKELYDSTLRRVLAVEGTGDFLRLLAEARDDVTPEMAAELLKRPIDEIIHTTIPACRELLHENELTQDIDDYQLFHESLREYLRAQYRKECRVWCQRLNTWCLGWGQLEDESKRYALQQLAAHARVAHETLEPIEAKDLRDEIFNLIEEEAYVRESFEELGHAQGYLAHANLVLDWIGTLADPDRQRVLGVKTLLKFHCEPHDRLADTLNRLDRPLPDPAMLSRLARSGGNARQNVLFALRGLCANPGFADDPEVRESLLAWADEANEPALKQLIECY